MKNRTRLMVFLLVMAVMGVVYSTGYVLLHNPDFNLRVFYLFALIFEACVITYSVVELIELGKDWRETWKQ